MVVCFTVNRIQVYYRFCEGILSDPCLKRKLLDLVPDSDLLLDWWYALQPASLSTWPNDNEGKWSLSQAWK